MSDNMNETIPQGFNDIYSLLTRDTCSVLCLKHFIDGGYIAVDKDLSNIYISANDFINASNAVNSNTSVCICYSEGGGNWSTSPLQFGIDDNLSSYVSISNCGQQYIIAIDISQVPIKRGICIHNRSESCKVQYGDAIYGHYHCNTEFDKATTANSYSDSNITYGQVCETLEPPSLNSSVSELGDNCLSPSKLPINRDYLCIPKLIDKPSQECICCYCIAMMHDSHYLFSANKDQLPMKYISVSDSGNVESIFTNDDTWKTNFNDRCHIYDGDLPYIDIRLLCQCNKVHKLPSSMIPYNGISFNSDSVIGNGSNSVTASDITNILYKICRYIGTYIGLEGS